MNIKDALIGLSMLMYTGCGIANCSNPELPQTTRYQTSLVQVSAPEFESRVLHSERPVVVEFYTEWCPACRDFEQPYEETAAAMRDRADFVRYDLEQPIPNRKMLRQHVRIVERFGVEFIPTVIVFRGGSAICRPNPADTAMFQHNIDECLR